MIRSFACPDTEALFHSQAMPRFRNIEQKNIFTRFVADQSGATAIEYGLIAGLIAVVIIGAVTSLGKNIAVKFNAVANNLS